MRGGLLTIKITSSTVELTSQHTIPRIGEQKMKFTISIVDKIHEVYTTINHEVKKLTILDAKYLKAHVIATLMNFLLLNEEESSCFASVKIYINYDIDKLISLEYTSYTDLKKYETCLMEYFQEKINE